MASTTLEKITTRAKSIRRGKPGMSWKSAVKKAGLEYRQGRIGKAKKKRSAPKKKRKKISGNGQTTKSRTHTDYNRNKVNISVGSVSAHMGAAKKILLADIGKKEAQKFAASKKSAKKKIQQSITKLKRQFRRVAC